MRPWPHLLLIVCALVGASPAAGAPAWRPSPRVRQRAERFEQRLGQLVGRGEHRWPAPGYFGQLIACELKRMREGERFSSSDRYGLDRHLVGLGAARGDYEAALAVAMDEGRHARLATVLRDRAAGTPLLLGEADGFSEKVVRLLDGVALWRATKNARLEKQALRELRALAKAEPFALKEALAAPVGYEKRAEIARRTTRNETDDGTFQVQQLAREWGRAKGAADLARRQRGLPVLGSTGTPRAVTRRPIGHGLWWTGPLAAYLDLMHRHLPAQLIDAVRRGQKTFRIWHAGHEDGSQTFLLAAMVERAVEIASARQPELRRALDALKLEVHATDLAQRARHEGRRFSFNVLSGPIDHTERGNLLLDEIGVGETQRAARSVRRVEAKLERVDDQDARAALLERMADLGAVGLLFARFFELAPEVQTVRTRGRFTVQPSYQLETKRWQVVDREALDGQVWRVNTRVRDKRITFQHADLVVGKGGAPRGGADLVVCTNVLPWLKRYAEDFPTPAGQQGALGRALANLERALGKSGRLVIDVSSARDLQNDARDVLQRLGERVLVTRPGSADPPRQAGFSF